MEGWRGAVYILWWGILACRRLSCACIFVGSYDVIVSYRWLLITQAQSLWMYRMRAEIYIWVRGWLAIVIVARLPHSKTHSTFNFVVKSLKLCNFYSGALLYTVSMVSMYGECHVIPSQTRMSSSPIPPDNHNLIAWLFPADFARFGYLQYCASTNIPQS